MVINERNGNLVGALQVVDGDEMMLISNQGTLVRTRVSEVSIVGRNTQGVRLIKLADDEFLVGIERIEEPSEEEGAEVDEILDGDDIAADEGAEPESGEE